jgi:hypothetical protein
MGFDLHAFLGRTADLRAWEGRLGTAVACELSGDLGMVPVTGEMYKELRARLGEEEAARLDATRTAPTYPSPSHGAGARRWAAEASKGTAVAYVCQGEFGDFGYDQATVWSDGAEVVADGNLQKALHYFTTEAGFDLGNRPIDLEQYRGEEAAEKWVAAERARRGGAR